MSHQITASKVELLLQCARPFDPAIEPDEPEEVKMRTQYGTDFHALLEIKMKERGVFTLQNGTPGALVALDHHTDAAKSFLEKWLAGDNLWKTPLDILGLETHLATRIRRLRNKTTGKVRFEVVTRETAFDAASHTYQLDENEIGGTPDLVAAAPGLRVVVDYKTGSYSDYSDPQTPQMLTLALQMNADAVAIFHTPPGAIPVMYESIIDKGRFTTHVKSLLRQRARIGDGSMRTGPSCRWCTVRESCPTQHAELLNKTTALVKKVIGAGSMVQETDRGVFYPMIGKLGKLVDLARQQIKEEVEAGAVYETPDGKVLQIVKVEGREFLSKLSILKALGPGRGEELIESLRAQGAIDVKGWTELRAK